MLNPSCPGHWLSFPHLSLLFSFSSASLYGQAGSKPSLSFLPGVKVEKKKIPHPWVGTVNSLGQKSVICKPRDLFGVVFLGWTTFVTPGGHFLPSYLRSSTCVLLLASSWASLGHFLPPAHLFPRIPSGRLTWQTWIFGGSHYFRRAPFPNSSLQGGGTHCIIRQRPSSGGVGMGWEW